MGHVAMDTCFFISFVVGHVHVRCEVALCVCVSVCVCVCAFVRATLSGQSHVYTPTLTGQATLSGRPDNVLTSFSHFPPFFDLENLVF